MAPLSILYEDNHLLVVDKPAGIATMGTDLTQPTVARQAAAYLKQKYHKPGNVYVGVVSRLDRLVSGVLLLARTSKAASRLSEQLRRRAVQKRYLTCVEGDFDSKTNEWIDVVHWVCKDERRQRMQCVEVGSDQAKEAKLRFRRLARDQHCSLLEVDLLTGRKHQIRLQLAELGHPVLGDVKYGSKRSLSPGIALHSHRLTILHPTKQQPLEFRSSPAKHWRQIPRALLAAISTD